MLPDAQAILRNIALLSLFRLQDTPTVPPIVSPTVPPVVSPTAGAEATPLPTMPVAPAPTPAPSPWNPVQWYHASGWVSNFHGVFLVLFALIAVAAAVAYVYFAKRRFKEHSLNARLAERLSYVLTAFATVGLLLLVCSLSQVPLLSMPMWLIITTVAFIAFVVYAIFYYVTVYPSELARYQRERDRARYLPKPRGKGPAYTPPMKKRQPQGKQRRKKR
jgi:hypothetical protein